MPAVPRVGRGGARLVTYCGDHRASATQRGRAGVRACLALGARLAHMGGVPACWRGVWGARMVAADACALALGMASARSWKCITAWLAQLVRASDS